MLYVNCIGLIFRRCFIRKTKNLQKIFLKNLLTLSKGGDIIILEKQPYYYL